MAHATGTRLAALIFLLISLIPPWIQAVVTIPVWLYLLRKASEKEETKERQMELLEKHADGGN